MFKLQVYTKDTEDLLLEIPLTKIYTNSLWVLSKDRDKFVFWKIVEEYLPNPLSHLGYQQYDYSFVGTESVTNVVKELTDMCWYIFDHYKLNMDIITGFILLDCGNTIGWQTVINDKDHLNMLKLFFKRDFFL